ncbi:hypothetical protein [Acidovorax sp. SUPP950]|uniref:hypothetical protein n=1 Tax=Acidovorax sp. SUPP950 TaxID=511901 RepID=UPI0024E13089|nr:hypothetical protein [Acidovorax sp. SUPP950]
MLQWLEPLGPASFSGIKKEVQRACVLLGWWASSSPFMAWRNEPMFRLAADFVRLPKNGQWASLFPWVSLVNKQMHLKRLLRIQGCAFTTKQCVGET